MPVSVSYPISGIALVTLSNPGRRNALDEACFRDLAALWPQLEALPVRCVVLTGADGDFSSGADLSAGLTNLPDIDRLVDDALLKSRLFRRPIVAAVGGVCVAGGLELLMSCDIRLSTRDCRFGFPEARWGIFPAGGAATKLAGEIGYAAAAELLLTGRLFDAAEALRLGLVNRIVHGPALLDEALGIAAMIASNSPFVVSAIRTYLSEARVPDDRLLQLEADLVARSRAHDDMREGHAAFIEKRQPRYRDPER